MIVGVMSDTHGNAPLLHAVADQMRDVHGVDVIVHAGDDYPDAEELRHAGYAVEAVPGLACDAYFDGSAPRLWVKDFAGVAVACCHAEQDLRAKERAATVVITGHTHHARVDKLGQTVYFNPGHLKAPRDRGEDASYGVMTIAPDAVRIAVYEASGAMRSEATFSRGDLA